MSTVPSAREIRRWTAARTSRRRTASRADVLSDVYTAVFTVVVYVAMVGGLLRSLTGGAGLPGAGERAGLVLLDPAWLAVLAGALLVALTWSITARLGPLGAPAHARAWWYSLPVDRRGLLRPALVVRAALGSLPGVVAGALVGLGSPGLGHPVALALAGGALAAAGIGAQVLAQARAGRRRRSPAVAASDALVGLVLLAGLAVALLGFSPPRIGPAGVAWPLAGAAIVAAAVALVAAARSTPSLHDLALGAGGDVSAESLGAVLSVDTRALGRALDRGETPPRLSGRGVRGPGRILARAPGAWRPALALALADTLLLTRSPRRLAQPVLGAVLVLAMLGVPGTVWPALVALVVGTYASALALVEGARQAQLAPALDALLPLGQRAVRGARLLVPAALMCLWGIAVGAAFGAAVPAVGLAAAGGGAAAGSAWATAPLGAWAWPVLGAVAGIGVAAGALRGAYRPVSDYSGTLVVTPAGIVPTWLVRDLATGPDLALLALTPVGIAVLVGSISPLVLLVQAVATVLAVVWATSPGR